MSPQNTISLGQWHGSNYYFGCHNDLHAYAADKDIGAHCNASELIPMIKLAGADFWQTDSKGHPGYTSWFSQTPTASVAPGIIKDPLKEMRAATKQLGLPLHCHYSGLFDQAAGAKHPDWCIRDKDGKLVSKTPGWDGDPDAGERMCPRGPYVDELMIPQLFELIDRYDIDGFWIDGDVWGIETCYCDRCRRAFKEKTGIAEPPRDALDPNWTAWWNFTRESFEEYVTHYCDAIHHHKPGVLVASNWYQGFPLSRRAESPDRLDQW